MKCQVDTIQWGGGSSRNFLSSPEAVAIQWGGGGSTIHFSLMGPFYIFGIFKRGGPGPPGPPGPPLNRPLLTVLISYRSMCR